MDGARDELTHATLDPPAVLVGLWRRLIDAEHTHVSEHRYGRDWPVTVENTRIADALAADGDPGEDWPVSVVLAAYSDYSGSTCEVANVRTLESVPGVRVERVRYLGQVSAVVDLGQSLTGDPTEDAARLAELAGMAEALDDYPVLDEHTLAEVERELQEQAWEPWLWSDVRTDLRELAPDEDAEDAVAEREPAIREAYYAWTGQHGEWIHDSASCVHHSDHEAAVAHLAATVLGWAV